MGGYVKLFNGTAYAHIYNFQGDVIALVDANGTKVVEYRYDAWGKPLSKFDTLATTLGMLNPFRYCGYVLEEKTELLHFLRSGTTMQHTDPSKRINILQLPGSKQLKPEGIKWRY